MHLQVVSTVRDGPAQIIAEIAKLIHADVIIVGTRGHGPVSGLLVGSVAQRLLHLAPCPVLVIPVAAPAGDKQESAAAAATTA